MTSSLRELLNCNCGGGCVSKGFCKSPHACVLHLHSSMQFLHDKSIIMRHAAYNYMKSYKIHLPGLMEAMEKALEILPLSVYVVFSPIFRHFRFYLPFTTDYSASNNNISISSGRNEDRFCRGCHQLRRYDGVAAVISPILLPIHCAVSS